jgi:hypothetical protein
MKWYVLRGKPNKKNLLYRQLFNQQIEFYFPTIKVKAVNPRFQKIKPSFPGYPFVHVDKEFVCLSALSWIPGAVGLVKFGGELAEISTLLLTAIKQQFEKINTDDRAFIDNLRSGNKVLVE